MKRAVFAFLFLGLHGLALAQQPSVSDTLYAVITDDGIEAALSTYHQLKAQQSDAYDVGPQPLNALGYRLLNEGQPDAAIAIFELNVEVHPSYVNGYDSLAEAYVTTGQRDRATPLYRTVLDLLPEANLPQNAKNLLRRNAETALFVAEHFDPPSDEALHYVAFYGGVPAGTWDMENMAGFNDQHPDQKVSYEGFNLYRRPVPNNLDVVLEADVASSFIPGVLRDYIEQGQLADLSDLWEEQGWDDAFPASLRRMVTFDGKTYFVPQAFQWNPIWYRADIFAELDLQPPTTWNELLDLCDALREAGHVPFSISGAQWPPPMARWFTILNLRLHGPAFHDDVMRGRVSFTDPRIRTVFEHWQQLFEHEAFADSSADNTYAKGIQDLVSGRAVMYNLGEWLFESLSPEMGKKMDFFPMPVMDPDVPSAEIVHLYGSYLPANSNHPEAARDVLAYLGNAASQQTNVQTLQRINSNTNVDPALYTDVQRRAFAYVKNTEVLVPLFELNTKPEMARAGLQVFLDFWRHPEDIDAALDTLEQARKQAFPHPN